MEQHLKQSADNTVVFTDFALAETYNGANSVGLKRTLKVVASYPAQIHVLKSTPAICALMPSHDGLHERFLDEVASNAFRTFCHDLFHDAHDMDQRIEKLARAANRRIEGLLPAGNPIREDIRNQLSQLPADGLKILRSENRFTEEMARAFTQLVTKSTIELMEGFGDLPGSVGPREAVYSFQLRFALANCILGLDWGVKGGVDGAAPKTLRNDITDMSYVAYATLFDGLVTNDAKMDAIYRNARNVLTPLFGV